MAILQVGADRDLLLRQVKAWPLPAAVLEPAQAGIDCSVDWQPVLRLEEMDMLLVPSGCFPTASTEVQLHEVVHP